MRDVICSVLIYASKMASLLYRDDFNSLDEFPALRFTATGAPPAARGMRILPITSGIHRSEVLKMSCSLHVDIFAVN
jgi:hypothetical protein